MHLPGFLALLLFAATATVPSAANMVAPILNTPEAQDIASFAQPRIARVSDVALNLTADFALHTLAGTATLAIHAAPDAQEIVLDTRDLHVSRVTDGRGRALKWTIGAVVSERGAPLTVQLSGAKRIIVHYVTSPNAAALQWLAPAQTAGKALPFLFSQGEPNLNRSWIPTQDSPGIRQSWRARIVVPEGLTAVMSAANLPSTDKVSGHRVFRFRMDNPVPPYLIALAIGDLRFQALGPRTGVWTEPSMLGKAAAELVDTEKMVETAEALYGPYRWGRYDVLVLPPAFPYGGMENPRLTFLTPTFITGDRSQVSLVAHELAHSWSGNLVTNATWSDSWLNEGFTSYFENRIMEGLYGRARAEVEADLSWDELQAAIAENGGPGAPATRLHGEPFGGVVDYVKGAAFLFTLEAELGRPRFDRWLRGYFDRNAFHPQTTAGLLSDLRDNLIQNDAELEKRLRLDEWVYAPGLPANAKHILSADLVAVDAAGAAFTGGAPAATLVTKTWTTHLWLRFLNRLPRQLEPAKLADLDQIFGLSATANLEIRFAWLDLAIVNHYDPALASSRQFLSTQGRGKFVVPIYKALLAQPGWGEPTARASYTAMRGSYHPLVAARIDKLIK